MDELGRTRSLRPSPIYGIAEGLKIDKLVHHCLISKADNEFPRMNKPNTSLGGMMVLILFNLFDQGEVIVWAGISLPRPIIVCCSVPRSELVIELMKKKLSKWSGYVIITVT